MFIKLNVKTDRTRMTQIRQINADLISENHRQSVSSAFY